MKRALRAALAASLLPAFVAACTGADTGEPMADPTPVATSAPRGPTACDFLSKESIATILGTDDFTTDGEIRHDDDSGWFSGTSCGARLDGEPLDAVRVSIGYMMGMSRPAFERGLDDPDRTHLPASRGLGYSWTQGQETGEGRQVIGRALLSRGDHLINVSLVATEGRDPAEDAMALAQQTVASLEIPDEWTLDGEPPGRGR